MQELFFQFLTRKSTGDLISEDELLSATGWKPSTVQAYRGKNILDPFLTPVAKGQYRVLRDGASISKGDVAKAFTQKRPEVLVLTKGLALKGERREYSLKENIGQGAVAHVWSATAADGGGHAVKILMPRRDLLEPKILDNVRRRFTRESRHGMRLNHEHIVVYRDVGKIESHPFLVMERADYSLGSTLARRPLSLRRTLRVISDCLSGLAYLHSQDCVHRDIKPSNILQFGERSVLGDLGIVQWSDMNAAFTSAGTITRDSVQLGSWYYMAPEQRRTPHEVSPLSDVYALGITWYELLTSRTPDPAEVGAQAVQRPTGNDLADDLILQMISFSAEHRPEVAQVAQRVSDLIRESGD